MLNCLQNCKCSFIFETLILHTTTPKSPPKILSFTSVNFHLTFPPFRVNKIILKIHINNTFLYIVTFFHLAIFTYNHPSNLHQKCFTYLSHLAISGCVKGRKSYGVLWGFLISHFFLKVWTVVTTLTVTVPYHLGSKNDCNARSSLW